MLLSYYTIALLCYCLWLAESGMDVVLVLVKCQEDEVLDALRERTWVLTWVVVWDERVYAL